MEQPVQHEAGGPRPVRDAVSKTEMSVTEEGNRGWPLPYTQAHVQTKAHTYLHTEAHTHTSTHRGTHTGAHAKACTHIHNAHICKQAHIYR